MVSKISPPDTLKRGTTVYQSYTLQIYAFPTKQPVEIYTFQKQKSEKVFLFA